MIMFTWSSWSTGLQHLFGRSYLTVEGTLAGT